MTNTRSLYMLSIMVVILSIIHIVSGCASSSKMIGDEPYYHDTPWPLSRVTPSMIRIEKHLTLYAAFDKGPLHRKPKIIYYVKPHYPMLARQAGIEGTAVLEVVIDTNGKVVNAEIIKSSVTPSMERSLLEAAEQYVYRPGRRRHKHIKCRVRHVIRFTLNADVIEIQLG